MTDAFHRRLLWAGVIAWIAVVVASYLANPPLGHDETAYALEARAMLRGDGPLWFYRSTGASALGVPGILLGGSTWALRLAPLVLSIAFIAAVAHLGRRVLGTAPAAWAVAILAGTHPLVPQGARLLSDLPATTCLLLGAAILASELDRPDGPRWRLIAAAPLVAAAFYLRFASVAPIAILAGAALLTWPRAIAARPLPVLAAAVLLTALLLPHALFAVERTGSPLGLLVDSSKVPRRAYVGEGLVTYLTTNPFVFYGFLAPVLLVGGLAAIARPADRARRFLWLAAVGQIVVLGLQTHAVPRYVFFATVVLILLGADALVRLAPLIASWRPRAAALAAVVVAWAVTLAMAGPVAAHRHTRHRWTMTVARLLRADAAGRTCSVIARNNLQTEWYSGCRQIAAPDEGLHRGDIVYLVDVNEPPPHPDFTHLLAVTTAPFQPSEFVHIPGVLRIVRLTPPPPIAP